MAKVLIVDDSMVFRKKMEKHVKELGHESILAANGEEGLQAYADNSGVALVLTDLNMPKMNGMDMVDKIKQDQSSQETVFVVMSSVGQGTDEQVKRGQEIGINYWLSKTVEDASLVTLIEKVLAGK